MRVETKAFSRSNPLLETAPQCDRCCLVAGNRLPRGSKIQGSLGFDHARPLTANLTGKDLGVNYGREFLGALIEYRGEPMSWGAEARVRF